MITAQSLTNWLSSAYPIVRKIGNEVNFPCPRCQHPQFYFNVKKGRGFCHRASCHWAPSIEGMEKYIGYPPGGGRYQPITDLDNNLDLLTVDSTVELPEGAQLISCNPLLFKALEPRGIDSIKALKFNIHYTNNSFIIPVYQDGKIVNYVQRIVDFSQHDPFDLPAGRMRYLYPKDVSTTRYLFDWDHWKNFYGHLTLVENTFNAIWLSSLNVTTNFGSYLATYQIKNIIHSPIRSVSLLWDEGTQESGEKAVLSLRKAGIPAIHINIKGQPDNYLFDEIKEIIKNAIPTTTT